MIFVVNSEYHKDEVVTILYLYFYVYNKNQVHNKNMF